MTESSLDAQESGPFNLEIEQALLGAVLVNSKDVLLLVRDRVSADDFYEPVHGEIYQAACRLDDQGNEATPPKLKPQFQGHEALKDVGGVEYLVRLAASAATILNSREYAETVRDLSKRRELLYLLDAVSGEARNADISIKSNDVIEKLEIHLHEISGYKNKQRILRDTPTVIEDALERYSFVKALDGRTGLTTGLASLDKMVSLNPSEFTILAGRPAMGKSALANFISIAASRGDEKQEPVNGLFFSKEMPAEDNIYRTISCEIHRQYQRTVPYSEIRAGAVSEIDEPRVMEVAEALKGDLVIWSDEARLTPGRIRSIALREKRRLEKSGQKLGFITIDYLQQVLPDKRSNRGLYEDMTLVSGAMLELAKELQIPVLGLCQLSRAVEQREDKRPIMADLRDSGAFEQDAANIIFVYREEYYLKNSLGKMSQVDAQIEMDKVKNIIELIIAKNRNGATGNVKLYGNLATNYFADLAGAA